MEQTVAAFFVYGTLKRKQLRGNLWPRQPVLISEGIIRATLYDLGPYPGALPGDGWTLGELWQFASHDVQPTMEVLDRIEGYESLGTNNEYVRQVIEVLVKPRSEDGADTPESYPAFAYFVGKSSRLKLARTIPPLLTFLQRPVSAWPDAQSRVPRSFAEE